MDFQGEGCGLCGATNNNPAVIAQNYLNCVRSLGVIHMRLRTDLVTDNGTMGAIQCTQRHAHKDHYAGSSSHSYGSSTGNQRIESWWSFLRRGRWVNVCLIDIHWKLISSDFYDIYFLTILSIQCSFLLA